MNRPGRAPTPPTEAAPTLTQEVAVSRVKKAVPVYPPFSPYNLFYYCARCERWIPKEAAKRNSMGYPCCPYCGNPLRLKPRNGKRWEP